MTNAVNLASAAGTGFFRNRLINGDFKVAQRGTTGTSGYTSVDRWRGSNTTTFSQTTTVPTGFKNSLRFANGSAIAATAEQRIEAINCYDLVGQKVTVSLWAQNVTGSSPLVLALDYPVGLDDWTTQTNIATQTIDNSPSTNWTFYSWTFDALPANVANGLSLKVIRTNAAASDTRITGVQLEVGSIATPFERRQYGQELALCQRYYQKTYDISVAPATATRTGMIGGVNYSNSTNVGAGVTFPVRMRADPTVTVYDGAGTSGKCSALVGPSGSWTDNNASLTVVLAGEQGFNYNTSVNSVSCMIHYTASAEL